MGQASMDAGETHVFFNETRVAGGLDGVCATATLSPAQNCRFRFLTPSKNWGLGVPCSLKPLRQAEGLSRIQLLPGQAADAGRYHQNLAGNTFTYMLTQYLKSLVKGKSA